MKFRLAVDELRSRPRPAGDGQYVQLAYNSLWGDRGDDDGGDDDGRWARGLRFPLHFYA